MTTDTIREKFEAWFDNNTMGWTEEDKVLSRVTWEDAYQQGQRDLIEAMEQYTTIMKDGTPLYRLPEDTQK